MRAPDTASDSENHFTEGRPRFWVGTSGWIYSHWKGTFYPADLAKSRWFDFYTSLFNTVEINATFYRRFKDQTYIKWRERAPQGFRYVFKVPRVITHLKYLSDVGEEIRAFWHSVSLVEDRLGLVLLQTAPGMPYEPARLKEALEQFGDPTRVAVEFRRKEWLNPEVVDLLRSIGAVFCTADSPRTKLNDWITSSAAYIRLHGRRQWYADNYRPDELREIADLARHMAAQGARDVYIFFNNDFEAYAPKNALALRELLEGS